MDLPSAWSEKAYESMLDRLRSRFGDIDVVHEGAAERWLEVRQMPGATPADARELTALCLKYAHMRVIDLLRKERGPRRKERLREVQDRRRCPVQAAVHSRVLETCLARLPHRQRELIDRAYFEGLSDCEIARRLMDSEGTGGASEAEGQRPANIPRENLEAARKRVNRERRAALEALRRLLLEAGMDHAECPTP